MRLILSLFLILGSVSAIAVAETFHKPAYTINYGGGESKSFRFTCDSDQNAVCQYLGKARVVKTSCTTKHIYKPMSLVLDGVSWAICLGDWNQCAVQVGIGGTPPEAYHLEPIENDSGTSRYSQKKKNNGFHWHHKLISTIECD